MNTPRLHARQTSEHSCAVFGGIDRTPDAQLGHWADARNLSCDHYPTMICAQNSTYASNEKLPGVDAVSSIVVAMCQTEPPAFLDLFGNLYCNGFSVSLGDAAAKLQWKIRFGSINGAVNASVPERVGELNLDDFESETFPGKNLVGQAAVQAGREQRYLIRFEAQQSGVDNGTPFLEYAISENGLSYMTTRDLSDYGITLSFLNAGSDLSAFYEFCVSKKFYLEIEVQTITEFNKQRETLIPYGANIVVLPQGIAVNAVRLASGQTIRKQDITEMALKRTVLYLNNTPATISMCKADGSGYDQNEVFVSIAAPNDHDKIWYNPKENGLFEWYDSMSMWVRIQTTYVKINHIQISVEKTLGAGVNYDSVIREGDVLKFTSTYLPDFTDFDVEELLNGAHKVVKTLPDENAIVVPGILGGMSKTTTATWTVERRLPSMDFVVSCENRLWGCRYSEEDVINEIYASALGDLCNWEVYQGISTDAWRASRGTAAPYTGATVFEGKPLFFREYSMDKVYPSADGAHQIQEFLLDGVEEGAADSLCVIAGRLYYKSRLGVMVYTGTYPTKISGALGDLKFSGGSAGRHNALYCLCTNLTADCSGDRNERVTLVYDTVHGEWNIHRCSWQGKPTTYHDKLFYITDQSGYGSNLVFEFSGRDWFGGEEWYAESAPQAIHYWSRGSRASLTEHKWISYVRIRFRVPDEYEHIQLEERSASRISSKLKIYISYDEKPFVLKRELSLAFGTRLHTVELAIMPRRRDNFRLRLEGTGPVQIFDINYQMERSEGGH